MNARIVALLCSLVAITALAISIAALRVAHGSVANRPGTIAVIAAMTKQLDETRMTLQSPSYREGTNGALEAYLVRLRRDGAVRSAAMKQQLDNLAAQVVTLRALVDLYAPEARTQSFRDKVPSFRAYALSWLDRWNALLEIFMAGGSYPASEFAYPDGWSAAVEAELAASK